MKKDTKNIEAKLTRNSNNETRMNLRNEFKIRTSSTMSSWNYINNI